ncbi:MAG: hypothetical protein H8E66_19640 [Planctomycetes bacterium]|nr:hypothetical protein [Planctomycetota bacterium]
MNQLGKNLVLSLCVVATLLVILGLKRKFGGANEASLLSQKSEDFDAANESPVKSSPQPRVLQAKPVTQRGREIVSPTGQHYSDSAAESSPIGRLPIAPISTASTIAKPAPRSLAPDLVQIDERVASPVTANIGDQEPESARGVKTPTVPVATRTLPEFVLTGPEDSFWSISEQVYRDGTYYRALFRHNESKVLRPDQLRAGIEIRTPPIGALRELYPADCPKSPSAQR